MATTALATIEELGELPPPSPARPRVLLVATALATAASVMLLAALLAVYAEARAGVIADGTRWLPEGVEIPLSPGNLSLVGFGLSCVTMQWAVHAIGVDDRRHAWMAFGATLVVGAFHLVGMGFLYSQMGLAVTTMQGALIYAVTGAHLAMLGAAMLFAAVMAFRTLGGQYSARDREGVVAAAVYWYATAAMYFAVWYVVLVTK
jgi:heme/copper-type cytochrome/quinol oxidase subunit 3